MAATAPSTLEGFLQMVPTVDVTADLPAIACRGLIVTTTLSPLGSVADVRRWQQTIPRSELAVIEGDCITSPRPHLIDAPSWSRPS